MIQMPGSAIFASEDIVQKAASQIMCKNALDTLYKKYPGYTWMVMVDDVGGIMNIECLNASGRIGFTLHLNNIVHDVGVLNKEVMRAGGELLERYGLSRNRAKADEIQNMKRDYRQEAVQV